MKKGFSGVFVVVVAGDRLAQIWRGGGGGRDGRRGFGGDRGSIFGFMLPMQGDDSQNAEDVHMEVHGSEEKNKDVF